MYKTRIQHLEGFKKQLEASNKVLTSISDGLTATAKVSVTKQIKANEKQIKLIKDEYYID